MLWNTRSVKTCIIGFCINGNDWLLKLQRIKPFIFIYILFASFEKKITGITFK